MDKSDVMARRNQFFPAEFVVLARSHTTLLVSLILLSLVTQVKAQEYTVHVGPNGYAPFAMIDRKDGDTTHYGVMFDFLDAFEAKHPEFTRKTVLLTRKRVNAKMGKGEEIDLMFNSPLFVSPEIMTHYKFTDTFFRTEDKVVTRKDQNFTYKTPHDLHGKTVGAIRGYSYGQFDFLIKFGMLEDVRVDSQIQGIGMLQKKRIDAYLGNIHVTPLYIKELGLDLSDFVFSDVSLYQFDFAFAVSKRRPELYSKLNGFLKKFVADGSLDKLLKKYLE